MGLEDLFDLVLPALTDLSGNAVDASAPMFTAGADLTGGGVPSDLFTSQLGAAASSGTADAIARAQAAVAAGGAPSPSDLAAINSGFGITGGPSIGTGSGTSAPGLGKLFSDALDAANAGKAGSGGGSFAAPRTATSVADRIGMTPVQNAALSPLPQTGAPVTNFQPIATQNSAPAPQAGNALMGLSRLIGAQNPYAEAQMLTQQPRGVR